MVAIVMEHLQVLYLCGLLCKQLTQWLHVFCFAHYCYFFLSSRLNITSLYLYRKPEKLRESKVLRFSGFYLNIRKTFVIFAVSALNVYIYTVIAQSSRRENFQDSLKIRENHEAFLSHSFCRLPYTRLHKDIV